MLTEENYDISLHWWFTYQRLTSLEISSSHEIDKRTTVTSSLRTQLANTDTANLLQKESHLVTTLICNTSYLKAKQNGSYFRHYSTKLYIEPNVCSYSLQRVFEAIDFRKKWYKQKKINVFFSLHIICISLYLSKPKIYDWFQQDSLSTFLYKLFNILHQRRFAYDAVCP